MCNNSTSRFLRAASYCSVTLFTKNSGRKLPIFTQGSVVDRAGLGSALCEAAFTVGDLSEQSHFSAAVIGISCFAHKTYHPGGVLLSDIGCQRKQVPVASRLSAGELALLQRSIFVFRRRRAALCWRAFCQLAFAAGVRRRALSWFLSKLAVFPPVTHVLPFIAFLRCYCMLKLFIL